MLDESVVHFENTLRHKNIANKDFYKKIKQLVHQIDYVDILNIKYPHTDSRPTDIRNGNPP